MEGSEVEFVDEEIMGLEKNFDLDTIPNFDMESSTMEDADWGFTMWTTLHEGGIWRAGHAG